MVVGALVVGGLMVGALGVVVLSVGVSISVVGVLSVGVVVDVATTRSPALPATFVLVASVGALLPVVFLSLSSPSSSS